MTPAAVHPDGDPMILSSTPPFEQLVREHAPMIRRIAASYEADAHSIEELVQEIWLALWRALPSFRGDAPVRSFVARIATNRAVTHVKRAVMAGRPVPLSEDLPAQDAGPEAETISLDRHANLLAAVRALPLAYRQAALLTLEGFTCGEVAAMLGISANAVSIRLSRAKDMLRTRMAGEQ